MFGLVRKSKYDHMTEKMYRAEANASYWHNRCEEYYTAMKIMEEELEALKRKKGKE